jgi:F-type H+-transporting ATPase subunit beta
MFDVFGRPIDRQPAPSDIQWRSVHRAPPPLSERSTKSEVFETGIKAIDVLVPLERAGRPVYSVVRGLARRCCSRR